MEEVFDQNFECIGCTRLVLKSDEYALSGHQVVKNESSDICDCLQCLFGSEMNHDFMFETLLCNLV